MKNLVFLLVTFFCCLHTAPVSGQQAFSSCAAAVLDQKMIVDEYTPEGKCTVSASASGELSVRPVFFTEGQPVKLGEKTPFKIAIRDSSSGTLLLFSDQTYREIDLTTVLRDCKKGDHIVLLTTDRQFALPHNEILVN